MPRCKNCNSQLNRYQKDMCPICGQSSPFENFEEYTTDLTQELSRVTVKEIPESTVGVKSRRKYSLFAMFLGVIALHLFYINKKGQAYIWLAMNFVAIALIGTILFFVMSYNGFAYLIGFGTVYLANLIFGAISFSFKDIKDGDGEFLR